MSRVAIHLMNLVARAVGSRNGAPIGLYREWRAFEGMLLECLGELGHDISIGTYRPGARVHDDADVRIFAHATSRDVPGELYYKQMHLRELFTIDHIGWGADHSASTRPMPYLSADPVLAESYCRSLVDGYLASGGSKAPQPPIGSTPRLPSRYIFVPAQVPIDYVNIHHSPITVDRFILAVARWGASRGRTVVIKVHPSCIGYEEVDSAVAECARLGEHVRIVDGNVHELIAGAAGVITINSGVGFESLIHGRPVVTFGNSDYRAATFAADESSLDEACRYIDEYTERQRREAWQFIHHYCFEHAFSIELDQWWRSYERLHAYLARTIPLVARGPHRDDVSHAVSAGSVGVAPVAPMENGLAGGMG